MKEVCTEYDEGETLLFDMQRALLDVEAKANAMSNKRNVIVNLEAEIKKAFYRDEDDAIQLITRQEHKITEMVDALAGDSPEV